MHFKELGRRGSVDSPKGRQQAVLRSTAMRMRSRLLTILAATSVPLLAFAILAVYTFSQREERNLENAALARNRATLTAADAELQGSVGVLRALAEAGSLKQADLRSFHDEARAVLSGQPSWQNIQLYDAAGEVLVNARVPWGTALPQRPTERASFDAALRLRTPTFGNLYFSKLLDGEPGIAVRVPIMQGERVRFILTAVLRPTVFQRLLEQQNLPQGWASGLVGTDGRMIARVPAVAPGAFASDDFRRHVAAEAEGWYRGRTLEGADTFTAFSRSSLTGWTVGYAVPSSLLLGSARRAGATMLGGLAVAFIVAGAFAFVLVRGTTAPMSKLRDQARRLGRGEDVEAISSAIDEVAEVSSALTQAARDVRDRDRALHEANLEVQKRLVELQHVNAARAAFLAQLAHELRNPLAPLVSGLAVLKATNQGRPASNTLPMMERQLGHLTRLVSDLSDIGRIDRGEMDFRKAPMDLRDAVASAIDACRPTVDARHQRLQLEVSPEPLSMRGDSHRLSQVIWNLMTNASKYSPERTDVVVEAGTRGTDLFVAVTDCGVGFEPSHAERLFELFYRASHDISAAPSGLGIGLSVARAIAVAHEGRLEASSRGPGRGATFTLVIPALPQAARVDDSGQSLGTQRP